MDRRKKPTKEICISDSDDDEVKIIFDSSRPATEASTSSGKRRPDVEIIAVIPKRRKSSTENSISENKVQVRERDEEMESYADVEDNIDDEETIEMEEELEQEMTPEDELRLLAERNAEALAMRRTRNISRPYSLLTARGKVKPKAVVPPVRVIVNQRLRDIEECLWQPSNCFLSDEELELYQKEAKEVAEAIFGNWDYDGSPLLGDCPLDLECLMKCQYNREEALILLKEELQRIMDVEVEGLSQESTSKFDTAEEVDENVEGDSVHNVEVTQSSIKEGEKEEGKDDVEMKYNIDSEPNVGPTPSTSTTNLETPSDIEMKDTIDSELNLEVSSSNIKVVSPKVDGEDDDKTDPNPNLEDTQSSTEIEDEGETTDPNFEGPLSASMMDTTKDDDSKEDIFSDPIVESTSQGFVIDSMEKDDTKEPNADVDESGVQSQMRTNNGASNDEKEKELEASCSIE